VGMKKKINKKKKGLSILVVVYIQLCIELMMPAKLCYDSKAAIELG
jgi:hypothetical protein